MEWLESKDIRKRNCVNLKHIVDEMESITALGIMVVKLNSKHEKASTIDLLDWLVPKKHHTKVHKPTNSTLANAVSFKRRKVHGGALKKGPYQQSKEDLSVFSEQ